MAAEHISDEDERLLIEIVRGQRPELRWATTFVKRHDWAFLAELHPKLAGLGGKLSVGLDDVLNRHENILLSPQSLLGKNEIKKLDDTLRQIERRLNWVADALAGPEDESETNLSNPTNKRLKTLGVLKRGRTLKQDEGAITRESFQENAGHHRLHLWLQLAEQIDAESRTASIEGAARGKKEGPKKTRLNPLVQVLAFQSMIRTWAQIVQQTQLRLLEQSREAENEKAVDANAALVRDLWKLWGSHLTAVGMTPKKRPIIEAPSSKIFLGIVGHLLKSFTNWRRQTDKPDQQHTMVRRKVQRSVRKT